MGGTGNTYINLNKSVEDHSQLAQQCLALSVTYKNSDHLYPDKGTDLIPGMNNVNIVDGNYAQHLANFAALDILSFLEITDQQDDELKVSDIDMSVIFSDRFASNVGFFQQVIFTDGKRTQGINSL